MSVSDTADALSSNSLRNNLAPDLYAQLVRDGSLPPAIVQAECTRMHAELTEIATYIPWTIVREQLVNPQPGRISGAYWNGSVLFADLSGFTSLSEQLSSLGKQGAEEISRIINSLFEALVEEIHRYHGVLLKFGGDAITAFFDAASLGDQHPALASQTALAMQRRMSAFAALVTPAGTFRLQLRIGVHSAQVFAAQVGDIEHIELVITGYNVNRVAFAQEIANPGEVVISRSTLALLTGASAEERQEGFHLLTAMPEILPPPPVTLWEWEDAPCDLTALRVRAERINALRPYLPRGLPRRFLEHAAPSSQLQSPRSSFDEGSIIAGEFRPVSVLFANFASFSRVLAILGEDTTTAAQVLNAYYYRAQEVIHRYGGIVNKVDMYTHGDKLMALFGAPIAHEDDPERTVRAALDLRTMLNTANSEIVELLHPTTANLLILDPQLFKQRIGINTGVVFAGQVGSSRRHEYTVMGRNVNLAARLMSAAEDGTIVLSPSTRRYVQHRFALHELPPAQLKGVKDPVPLAEVLSLLDIAQDPRIGTRPQLVGREAELGSLLKEAHAALRGNGRVVTLVGEAGTGKTRLIEDALQQLVLLSLKQEDGVPSFFPYSVECQSYEQNTPYAVIRQLLHQFFNLNVYTNPSAHTADHASALTHRIQNLIPDMARFAPLLGDILGLSFDETPLTTALTIEQRHDRAQELVVALLLAEARAQTLVLIVDDVHWIDASSLDLLARLAKQTVNVPLLLMFGYRSEPRIPEPWHELEHCVRISVGELSSSGSTSLVRTLLRGEAPPELDMLIEKAQGNPFFIEEVVRGMVESGTLQHTNGGWTLARGIDEGTIPDSIEGVITARLDRLGDHNREILQIASVIGRRFQYQLLFGVMSRHDNLLAGLGQLADADLIQAEEIERELTYLFKHALTRDVAYEAILYARRREIHRRIAQQIEQLHQDRIDEQLALLARHYLLAEDWQSAFDYHLRAGKQAQERFANREAISLFERALQIAARIEQAPDRRSTDRSQAAQLTPDFDTHSPLLRHMIDTLERLGVIYALIGEYSSALEHYHEALAILIIVPDTRSSDLVRLHLHIARVYEKRAEFDDAFTWIEDAMALADEAQNPELTRCLLLGAGLHKRQGRYAQALEWGERALRLAEWQHSPTDQAYALKLLGTTYLNQGDSLRALDLASRCLQLYEQAHDMAGLADAHNDLANIFYDLGRLTEARTHYEAGAEIKQTIGDVYGEAMIANNLGDLLRLQSKLDEAITQYNRSLSIFERLGSLYATGVLHMNLGAVHLLCHEFVDAEEHFHHSATLFDQAGAEEFLPELERYCAELHMHRGDLAEARRACELSLAAAARLEARAEEGMTRRMLGQILAQEDALAAAWSELERSLALLRETASPHEIARTLLAMAALAPRLGRQPEGQRALDEALPTLYRLDAQRDIQAAQAVAVQHGYTL